MSTPRFINLEGFEGVGKTTLAQWIADTYGYVYLKSPSGQFRDVRDEFDQPTTDPAERIGFYMGDCVALSCKISALMAEGKNVVLDRYVYTTRAFNLSDKDYDCDIIAQISDALLQPDCILFVDANFDTLYERITKRGFSENDKLFVDRQKFADVMGNYCELLDGDERLTVIDNNGSLEDAKRQIMAVLGPPPVKLVPKTNEYV